MMNLPPPTDPTPDWKPDPAGRYELRYWNGSAWTDDVSSAGQTMKDAASTEHSAPAAGYAYGQPAPMAPMQYSYGGAGMPATPDVGAAFQYGWDKFKLYWQQILVLAAIGFVGIAAVVAISFVAIIPMSTGTDVGFVVGILVQVAAQLLIFVAVLFFQLGLLRASLGITEGRAPSISDFTNVDRIGSYIACVLLSGLAQIVGLLACLIGSYVVAFLLYYGPYFVLDRRLDPMDALRASYELVRNNIGPAFVMVLGAFAALMLGTLACFVGIIVAFPVVQIATAYFYKALTGQPVAP